MPSVNHSCAFARLSIKPVDSDAARILGLRPSALHTRAKFFSLVPNSLKWLQRGVRQQNVNVPDIPHNNADLYRSTRNKNTAKMQVATLKTINGKCNNGTDKNTTSHNAMQISGILGPSVNHSLMAAIQKSPNAMAPKFIIWPCCLTIQS